MSKQPPFRIMKTRFFSELNSSILMCLCSPFLCVAAVARAVEPPFHTESSWWKAVGVGIVSAFRSHAGRSMYGVCHDTALTESVCVSASICRGISGLLGSGLCHDGRPGSSQAAAVCSGRAPFSCWYNIWFCNHLPTLHFPMLPHGGWFCSWLLTPLHGR